jgi:hypothetical protein
MGHSHEQSSGSEPIYYLTLAFGAADLGLQANLTILSQLEDIDEEDEASEQVQEDVPHAMGTIRRERCSIFQPIKHAVYNPLSSQISSPLPPYRFGNSASSMIGSKAAEIVAGPLPTTDILRCVAGDSSVVNVQKIHVKRTGTDTKNFLYCNEVSVTQAKWV